MSPNQPPLKLLVMFVSKILSTTIYIFFFMMLLKHTLVNAVEVNDAVDKRPDVSEHRQDIEDSKMVISDIISNEPFVLIKEEKIWNFEKEEKEDPEINPDIAWLTDLVGFITMLIEAALWILPLILLFYLYRYREYWLNLVQGKAFIKENVDIPDTLFGLDIRQQS